MVFDLEQLVLSHMHHLCTGKSAMSGLQGFGAWRQVNNLEAGTIRGGFKEEIVGVRHDRWRGLTQGREEKGSGGYGTAETGRVCPKARESCCTMGRSGQGVEL